MPPFGSLKAPASLEGSHLAAYDLEGDGGEKGGGVECTSESESSATLLGGMSRMHQYGMGGESDS